ncbi:carboxymuconolactone decarboxylase family protein [Haloarcula litorea]|uniref:carboxymuconolactone decarboxylase family protein n=1 Tax=Haloarcula litorea TaxID=3032579 RepID=UPI0023E8AA86|nr:carboxymuconolactone decarboxylase family protein [Halomicroarcula sp. GDY20]
MADETASDDLPPTANRFAEDNPAVWDAYTDLGRACSEAGPLDDETKRLVKLALAVGSQSEGAVHSHVRRGLDEGLSAEELQHVATLAIPTVGFPKAMAARSWVSDLTDE